MTQNIVAIGSAPSSGSTLLADIIDGQPFYTCGSETSLLTALSQLPQLGKLELCSAFISRDICKRSLYIDWDGLCEYGINPSIFKQLWNQSSCSDDFLDRIIQRYFALRGKPSNSLFFEKTPTNAVFSPDILRLNSVLGFIFIIRNPYYVITSMLKRGYSPYSAAAAWLQCGTVIENIASAGKAITVIKYENIVDNPVTALENISSSLNIIPGWSDKNNILENYLSNPYRKLVSRRTVKTWKRTAYGVIKSANNNISRDAYQIVQNMLNCRLSKHALNLYGFKSAPTFAELMDKYSYTCETTSDLDPVLAKEPSFQAFSSTTFASRRIVSDAKIYLKSLRSRPKLATRIFYARQNFLEVE